MTATTRASYGERSVTITRTFDAPRSLLFRLWTDPQHLARWWGPRSFTNPTCEIDVRPGGRIFIIMRGPPDTPYAGDYPMSGEFVEIVEPERIVFTARAENRDGAVQIDAHNTVTFTEQGGKTTLTIEARAIARQPVGAQMIAGMEAGWTESIDKLGELAASLAVRA